MKDPRAGRYQKCLRVSELPAMGKVMREVSFIFYQLECFSLYQAAEKILRKERKGTKLFLRQILSRQLIALLANCLRLGAAH